MYAVIQTGGKQYRAMPGNELKIEKVPGAVGDPVHFEKVLFTADGENIQVGSPYLDHIKVIGRITRQAKDRKIVVFKFKRRKNHRKKTGHRQSYTQVKIEEIQI
jgi:large subunit ribosomal protein L21